ncbi:MAG: hypothetical protein SGI88_08080 [Candidatus Hydrogenedentes bacterium]|nr:hypothetical protein [Candidatus Hydrogenedentota bacterium]
METFGRWGGARSGDRPQRAIGRPAITRDRLFVLVLVIVIGARQLRQTTSRSTKNSIYDYNYDDEHEHEHEMVPTDMACEADI